MLQDQDPKSIHLELHAYTEYIAVFPHVLLIANSCIPANWLSVFRPMSPFMPERQFSGEALPTCQDLNPSSTTADYNLLNAGLVAELCLILRPHGL